MQRRNRTRHTDTATDIQHRFLRFCQHLARLLDFCMWESHFVFNGGEPRFQVTAG